MNRRLWLFLLTLTACVSVVIYYLVGDTYTLSVKIPSSPSEEHHPTSTATLKPTTSSGPSMPAAMNNPATYCEQRLRDVKADPSTWQNPEAWLAEFALAPDDSMRTEVVALARQVDARFFVALLPRALEVESLNLRLSAARDIGLLPESLLPVAVSMGVAASDGEIRKEVLNVAANALPTLRPTLLGTALRASPFPDTRLESAKLLMDRPDHPSFEALLAGLDDSAPDVREWIQKTVEKQVGQRFGSAAVAQSWWNANRTRFDAMMLEIP